MAWHVALVKREGGFADRVHQPGCYQLLLGQTRLRPDVVSPA
jgi:hypothetical protein